MHTLTTSSPAVTRVGMGGRIVDTIVQPVYVLKGQLVIHKRGLLLPVNVTGATTATVDISGATAPLATLPQETKRKDIAAAITAVGAVRYVPAKPAEPAKPAAAVAEPKGRKGKAPTAEPAKPAATAAEPAKGRKGKAKPAAAAAPAAPAIPAGAAAAIAAAIAQVMSLPLSDADKARIIAKMA